MLNRMPTIVAQVRRRRSERRKPTPLLAEANAGEGYRRLCEWRAKHIPWLLQPGAAEILFRLINPPAGQPLRTSDLYLNAGASPPKVLSTLKEMSRKGLITIVADSQDMRRRHVAATDLLRQLARSYVQAMGQLLQGRRP